MGDVVQITREQLRSRRKHEVRAHTISIKRMTKTERAVLRALHPDDGKRRLPLTRGECVDGPRPCPLVSCAHHLYIDVNERTGAIKFNRPELQPEDMTESCALDVADRGGATLEAVGSIMNVCRERVRQVENAALGKLAGALQRFTGAEAEQMRPLPRLPAEADRDAGPAFVDARDVAYFADIAFGSPRLEEP